MHCLMNGFLNNRVLLCCREWKCLDGLAMNMTFLIVMFFTVGMQYIIVQYGGKFTKTEALTGEEWFATVVIGALSLPIGLVMRVIPPQKERKEHFAGYTELRELSLSDKSTNSSSKTGIGSPMKSAGARFFSRAYNIFFLGFLPLLAAAIVVCSRAKSVPWSHFAPLAHYGDLSTKYTSGFLQILGMDFVGGLTGKEL